MAQGGQRWEILFSDLTVVFQLQKEMRKGVCKGVTRVWGGNRAYWGVHVRAAVRAWKVSVHLVERVENGQLASSSLTHFFLSFLFCHIVSYFVGLTSLDLTT